MLFTINININNIARMFLRFPRACPQDVDLYSVGGANPSQNQNQNRSAVEYEMYEMYDSRRV